VYERQNRQIFTILNLYRAPLDVIGIGWGALKLTNDGPKKSGRSLPSPSIRFPVTSDKAVGGRDRA
jgi:hypothetical protein